VSLQAIAGDTYKLLENPNAHAKLASLAEEAHRAYAQPKMPENENSVGFIQTKELAPHKIAAKISDFDKHPYSGQTPLPPLHRPLVNDDEPLLAAWCVALVCHYYKGWACCPKLFLDGDDKANPEEIASGDAIPIAVGDTMPDPEVVSEISLRVRATLYLDGNSDKLQFSPGEKISELTPAATSVLRGRLDTWKEQFPADRPSEQDSTGSKEIITPNDGGASSTAVVPGSGNVDLTRIALDVVVDGGLAGVLQAAASNSRSVQCSAVMVEMLKSDATYYEWSADTWASTLKATKRTITRGTAWAQIMEWREANKLKRVPKKTAK